MVLLPLVYLPIIGRFDEAFGVYSEISCKKTVNASKIVIVNVIFSPESGGSQKTNNVRNDNVEKGNIM